MPTNANTFNSRVTSEALEKKFRDVFPAQGGAELVQDLYASGVVQPVIDFSSVAEGSVLPQNLQTAWDFSTGHINISNTTSNIITNTGFWKVTANATFGPNSTLNVQAYLNITDGLSTKKIWAVFLLSDNSSHDVETSNDFVVFLRAGDTLTGTTSNSRVFLDVTYRQIADVNGNLVNPLGFTFS